MNHFIAIVTGLHVLAHSIFGCCSHRGEHTTPRSFTLAAFECCISGSKHCCEPVDDCHDSHHAVETVDASETALLQAKCLFCESSSSPKQPHQCPHVSCDWLVVGTGTELATVALCNASWISEPADLDALFATVADQIADNTQRRSFALPLRTHLAVGVLII
jgi:hypothetical protein